MPLGAGQTMERSDGILEHRELQALLRLQPRRPRGAIRELTGKNGLRARAKVWASMPGLSATLMPERVRERVDGNP